MNSGAGRTVLVTGGSGFLGPYVVDALARDGWRVRLAQRAAAPSPSFDAVAVGPIGRATDWSAALDGVDAVVHLAARAHRPASVQTAERDSYVDTNTEGTLALARAAAERQVKHFVFASSILVSGASSDGRGPLRESDPPHPHTVYEETKAAAEAGLHQFAGEGAMAISIVRPTMIYGRRAKANFNLLTRALQRHVPLPFALVDNRRAFVAAENVASFMRHRLSLPAAGIETFNLADAEQVSLPGFIRRLAAALGVRALLLPVPVGLLRAALNAAGRSGMATSLLSSLEVDTRKALATGWRPAVSLDEGLRAAVGNTV